MTDQATCKDKVASHLKSRITDLRHLWKDFCNEDKGIDDLGHLNEYGLSFDYVKSFTFPNQKRGYFRYQISWGGPSEEFRFYVDERCNPTKIEFWYLDWFDGASINLTGKKYELMEKIFSFFADCDICQHLIDESYKYSD